MIACRAEDCLEDGCVQLTERESSVCDLICSSKEPVTFGRLKEGTALHQEIVSRILHRLMTHGLVAKTDDGYLGECGK
ncbi:MAG TPA: hypothetical protein VLU99_01450 [Nitrososphaerales archaeon]|nr:hypothetical protein [Nitrososphaerales archaeon]HUK74427.1 hypothetical protein [Nitrososphaerales archaeon]